MAQYGEKTVGSPSSAMWCSMFMYRFMQFTGCNQPAQHSHWQENAIDWLP